METEFSWSILEYAIEARKERRGKENSNVVIIVDVDDKWRDFIIARDNNALCFLNFPTSRRCTR